jgi:hypothetical protein
MSKRLKLFALELTKKEDGKRCMVIAEEAAIFLSEKEDLAGPYATLGYGGGSFVDVMETYDEIVELVLKRRCQD